MIASFAATTLLHGASARIFLVRPVRRFHLWLRCAVRVRPSRFRQWCQEGVCPREIFRCKTDSGNRQKETLINEASSETSVSLPERRTGCCEDFYRQRTKKFLCILNLQNWPRQMCCEKTGICHGSNRSSCADFAFGQLLDNPRNSPENGFAVASFFAQIAIIRELNCANTGCGCFYKWTKGKRALN